MAIGRAEAAAVAMDDIPFQPEIAQAQHLTDDLMIIVMHARGENLDQRRPRRQPKRVGEAAAIDADHDIRPGGDGHLLAERLGTEIDGHDFAMPGEQEQQRLFNLGEEMARRFLSGIDDARRGAAIPAPETEPVEDLRLHARHPFPGKPEAGLAEFIDRRAIAGPLDDDGVADMRALAALAGEDVGPVEQRIEDLPLRAAGAEIARVNAFEKQGFDGFLREKFLMHRVNPDDGLKAMDVMPRHRVFDDIGHRRVIPAPRRRGAFRDAERPIPVQGDHRVFEIGEREGRRKGGWLKSRDRHRRFFQSLAIAGERHGRTPFYEAD